jgi:arylsulfatase A-like enzyme
LLSDARTEKRSYVYSEIEGQNNNGYTIRDATFKLIVFNSGEERFYNLKEDPYETTNLLNAGLSEAELQAKENLESQAKILRE